MIWLYLLLLSFLPFVSGFVCPIYNQKLKDDGVIDPYNIPNRIGKMSYCDLCTSYKKGSTIEFSCILDRDLRHNNGIENCLKDFNGLSCWGHLCCCRSDDCFDKFRFHFGSKASKKSTDQKCKVTSYFLRKRPYPKRINRGSSPANILNDTSNTANSSISMFKTNLRHRAVRYTFGKQFYEAQSNEFFIRTTCAVCKAEFRDNQLNTGCVEYGRVNENCESYKNYIGGELACNDDASKCCCKGSNCDDEFLDKFLGRGLKSATINQPYSHGHILNPLIYYMFMLLLILFAL